MKPRNKTDKKILDLSTLLPKISKEQKKWGYQHGFKPQGYRTKKNGITCMECGHVFRNDEKKCKCPKCKKMLIIQDTRKTRQNDEIVLCILDTINGYQVARFFELSRYCWIGSKARYSCWEVIQTWMDDTAKIITIARRTVGFMSSRSWDFSKEMEISRTYYNMNPHIVYPKKKIIPILKQHGFKGSLRGISPYNLFTHLINDSHCETLYKANMNAFLELIIYRSSYVKDLWPTMKICIRNNYNLKDPIMWLDYINLLQYFKRDLLNAKYVCPINLRKEHDRYVIKKRIHREREEAKREADRIIRERIESEQALKTFELKKKQFFGLVITDGKISVRFIDSIEAYKEEADELSHCVYSSEYWGKPDTLCLSAQLHNKRLETVEVSLKSFDILQCHGRYNQSTRYHKKILKLVESNIPKIKRLSKRKFKREGYGIK